MHSLYTAGGMDFKARETSLSFNLTSNSSTNVCEWIQLLPDRVVEETEEFYVVVNSSNVGVTGSRSTVRIRDDDGT